MVYDNIRGTNNQQKIINDLQTITGLTLSVDSNTGLLTYAKDSNGKAIISSTTDASGNTVENGSASARTDLTKAIDKSGMINVGMNPHRSVTNAASNEVTLGESQINSFISGTPTELNNGTMGYGMVLMHEINHTNIGGGTPDGVARTDVTSRGPVVDRVNVYRSELDSNPNNTGNNPYGERRHYNAIQSGSSKYVRFRYNTTNRKGRSVRRTKRITF